VTRTSSLTVIEYGAAQLAAIALVARFAGGARVDHEHFTDATNQLVVGVAIQHEIRFCFAEPRQLGVVRIDVSPLRLPGGRVDEEQLFSRRRSVRAAWAVRRATGVVTGRSTPAGVPGRLVGEETLFVIAENGVGAALSEQANDSFEKRYS